MAEDANEQVEAEEIGEEVDVEAGKPAPRRQRGGFWAMTTLIFVVATAVLAWLYTVQLDELEAVRAQADQASSQVLRAQQANRQVKAELNELVDKLREIVQVVDALEGVEELQPTAEEAVAEEPEVAEEAEPAEIVQPAEDETEAGPQPKAPVLQVHPIPPRR